MIYLYIVVYRILDVRCAKKRGKENHLCRNLSVRRSPT